MLPSSPAHSPVAVAQSARRLRATACSCAARLRSASNASLGTAADGVEVWADGVTVELAPSAFRWAAWCASGMAKIAWSVEWRWPVAWYAAISACSSAMASRRWASVNGSLECWLPGDGEGWADGDASQADSANPVATSAAPPAVRNTARRVGAGPEAAGTGSAWHIACSARVDTGPSLVTGGAASYPRAVRQRLAATDNRFVRSCHWRP